MFELIATVISGGATGILGSIVGGVFKWLDRREERREAADRRVHEIKLQEMQIQVRAAETESELAIIQAESSRDQLMASYAHDSAVGPAKPWVAAVLRLVRPTLTFVLIGLTAAIYFTLEGGEAVVQGVELKAYIINTIVYTTSAAVLWWFGDRAMQLKK